MIEEAFKVKVFDDEINISSGTTYDDLRKKYQNKYKLPVVIAKQNGSYHELNDEIKSDGEIEFFDVLSSYGNRIYLNGLIYLTIYAIKELYGINKKVYVRYAIDYGLYIETSMQLTKEMLKEINKKMLETVESDLPIVPVDVDRLEAIEYFKKVNEKDKANMLKYNTNSYIKLYRLGNRYDYFFSFMVPRTGLLDRFKLHYIDENGFVLMYPDRYNKGVINEYKHHAQRFEVFNDYKEWINLMKIPDSAALNKVVSQGEIGNLIRIDETLQANKLLNIAKDIYEHKNRIKVILIAGPSSSGKTTTSLKLTNYLRSFGLNPLQISLDDYFVPRAKNPKKKDGSYDYECLEALDLKLLNKNIASLLDGKEIVAPVYNFIKGEPEYIKPMHLEDNDILILEGIHGLNPKLLEEIPRNKQYKIYISPMTGVNIDRHNRISTSDNRLLRRIIRDNRTRGYKVEDTMASWENVRLGEEKYIFPYQDDANVTYNTALIYELGILKTYAEPLLYNVDYKSEYYAEAKRLLNLLKTFLPIPSDDIPDDSVIREFIGGSCFKVN